VNSRRLQDLDKFANPRESVERIDNELYDFLNRESSKGVNYAPVNEEGGRLYVS